jgi:hypothetical protein
MQISYKQTVNLWKYVTRSTVDSVARASTRAEADSFINDYFGFIRTHTRFLDGLGFNTKAIQEEIAQFLRDLLKHYAKTARTDMVGYAEALKFAYEKLKYDDVKDIRWSP